MNSTQYEYRFDDVANAASGQWEAIVKALARVSYDWDKAIRKKPYHVPCPVHGGKDGFRLQKDFMYKGNAYSNKDGALGNGFFLLAWINNESIGKVLLNVAGYLHLDPNKPYTPQPKIKVARKDKADVLNAKAIRDMQDVWGASVAVSKGDPVDKYLMSRGIDLPVFPDVMHYHPALPYWTETLDENGYPVIRNNKTELTLLGHFPGMLIRFCNLDEKTVSIHRYFLTMEGGKADVPEPKKQMAAYKENGTVGAAFHLFAAAEEMGVMEGAETGFAVHLGRDLPVWPCGNANLLKHVQLPALVKKVTIFADKDRSGTGQTAAIELQERLIAEGREVIIRLPPGPIPREQKSLDWLDIWNEKGKEGFKF